MVERGLEAALDALDPEIRVYYANEDPETFCGAQWDMDKTAYNGDSQEYAEDMGMIYVEDLAEAEARYYAIGKQVLIAYAEEHSC